MVIRTLSDTYPEYPQPRARIREELVGGVAIDPITGKITLLDNNALSAWKSIAEKDDTVVYYATRQWSSTPLTAKCTSSPQRIYAEITNGCNLSCLMCYKNSGNTNSDELSTEELKSLINQFANIGVFELRITGGEPSTRHDLLELIDTALEKGFYLSIGSNGVWNEDFRENILKRRIGRFIISVDGIESVHESIRGAGSFKRTMATIDFLIANKQNVRVNTILTPSTLATLEEFSGFCKSYGIKHLSLVVPRPAGRSEKTGFVFPSKDDVRVAALKGASIAHSKNMTIEFQYGSLPLSTKGQQSDPVIQKLRACPAGTQAAFLSALGMIYPCGCMSDSMVYTGNGAVFENVRNTSAIKIWEYWQHATVWSSFRNSNESKMQSCFSCQYYGNGCFGSCPVHSSIASGSYNGCDPMCWQ